MTSLQLRDILMRVGDKLTCPHCKTNILPTHIEMESDNSGATASQLCTFTMNCHNCYARIPGQAQMMATPTEIGKKMNASSRLDEEHFVNRKVDDRDQKTVNHVLSSYGSFNDFFDAQKKMIDAKEKQNTQNKEKNGQIHQKEKRKIPVTTIRV